jgi:hypothetical protein
MQTYTGHAPRAFLEINLVTYSLWPPSHFYYLVSLVHFLVAYGTVEILGSFCGTEEVPEFEG